MFNQDQIATIVGSAQEALDKYCALYDVSSARISLAFEGKILQASSPALGHSETIYKFRTTEISGAYYWTWIDDRGQEVDPQVWLDDNS